MQKYDFSTNESEARAQKRNELFKKTNPYPSIVMRTHRIGDVLLDFATLENQKTNVSVAGRIRAQRVHGGSAFATIQDESGEIQCFFSKADIGESSYEDLIHLIDVGDFIEVNGYVFKTKKGERSVFARSIKILAKALLPLPEKWHGLSDVETRFRKRYLDLIMNKESREKIIKRTKIISAVREYCDNRGMLEVETPTLQPIYGGGFARPFKSHHNALNVDFYLRISDEMYLKRLLVAGFDAIYEITKVFRNEGVDRDHNPEFTMFEAQVAYKDYNWGMDAFEEIFEFVAKKAIGKTEIKHGDVILSFARPWKRMSVVDSIKEIGGLNVKKWKDVEEAKSEMRNVKIEAKKLEDLNRMNSIGEIIAFAFEELVEEKLIQPTIIYDYPVEVSPLAKKCEDERFTQRFEAFAIGMEIGNNYTELNDPVDLEKRFFDEKKKEEAGFEEAHQTDYDYLEAIKHGMPPACGLGIGIDRMVMCFTDSQNIKEVILFPTLKPKSNENDSE